MPMDPQAMEASAEDQGADQAQMQGGGQGGGAAKLVADTHTNMMKLMDLMGNKFPEEAKQLGGIISEFQQFVDGLGQPAGAQAPEQAGPATTTPEAGAAKVQPAM